MNDEWIDWDEEWAYWINPQTLRMPRLRGRVPVGAVVLIKTRDQAAYGDRMVVNTYFGLATSDGPDDLPGKKEANAIVVGQIVAYMRRTGAYPPQTSIKKEYKNGNVDLSYSPGDYDSFTLRVTRDLLDGEDPLTFLNALAPHVDEESEAPAAASSGDGGAAASGGAGWCVEHAKSGRASCRGCREKIGKGELRLGEPSVFEGRTSYRWYHLTCGGEHVRDPSQLDGFDDLDEAEKDAVQDACV